MNTNKKNLLLRNSDQLIKIVTDIIWKWPTYGFFIYSNVIKNNLLMFLFNLNHYII